MGCSCKEKIGQDAKTSLKPHNRRLLTRHRLRIRHLQNLSTPTPAMTDNNTPAEPRNVETITSNGGKLESVYFNFDKYDLSDAARATLVKNSQYLKANAGLKVRVEGNCDERGTVEYNLAHGQKRANVVKEYYASLGINADSIQIISFGEEKPLDPGKSEEAFAKNRRSDTKEIK